MRDAADAPDLVGMYILQSTAHGANNPTLEISTNSKRRMIDSHQYKHCDGIPYVTPEQVAEAHGRAEAERLRNWMYGQTMGVTPEGEIMIYAWDYEHWLRGQPPLD